LNAYKRLVRQAFFALPPEQAHSLAHFFLKLSPFWKLARPWLNASDPRLSTRLGDIPLMNPVGLAAGWDKDCRSLASLQSFGFGYLVGGTVMPEPQNGHHRPRMYRDTQREALINALGFPSQGVAAVVPRLRRLRRSAEAHESGNRTKIFVSVAAEDRQGFVQCHRAVEPWVDAVELNISSPNTQGLKLFHDPQELRELIREIGRERIKPLYVKLPPIEGESQRVLILELASVCVEQGVEGFTAVNTKPVESDRMSTGRGGLSGRPLFPEMLRTVSELRRHFGPAVQINACGGIFGPDEAVAAMRAGANSVQLLTAFNHEGPRIAWQINKGILAHLARERLASVGHLMPPPPQSEPSRNGEQVSTQALPTAI